MEDHSEGRLVDQFCAENVILKFDMTFLNFFNCVKNWKVLAYQYQTLCSNHFQVVTVQMK